MVFSFKQKKNANKKTCQGFCTLFKCIFKDNISVIFLISDFIFNCAMSKRLMFWRSGIDAIDVGMDVSFRNKGRLCLNVPHRFLFSFLCYSLQMCFLPENKSNTSLSLSSKYNVWRRQNCVKCTVGLRCRSLPQDAWILTPLP